MKEWWVKKKRNVKISNKNKHKWIKSKLNWKEQIKLNWNKLKYWYSNIKDFYIRIFKIFANATKRNLNRNSSQFTEYLN